MNEFYPGNSSILLVVYSTVTFGLVHQQRAYHNEQRCLLAKWTPTFLQQPPLKSAAAGIPYACARTGRAARTGTHKSLSPGQGCDKQTAKRMPGPSLGQTAGFRRLKNGILGPRSGGEVWILLLYGLGCRREPFFRRVANGRRQGGTAGQAVRDLSRRLPRAPPGRQHLSSGA